MWQIQSDQQKLEALAKLIQKGYTVKSFTLWDLDLRAQGYKPTLQIIEKLKVDSHFYLPLRTYQITDEFTGSPAKLSSTLTLALAPDGTLHAARGQV